MEANMNSTRTRRKSRFKDFSKWVCAGSFVVIVLLVFALIVLAISGCAASSRTNVSPASTSATHETRHERAGRTVTSETELEITPPSSTPAGGDTDSQVKPQSTGAEGIGATTTSPFHPAVARAPLGPGGVNSVSGVGRMAPLTPVAFEPEQRGDSIGEAIREAVRNGYGVKLKTRETEEIPLTADTSNSSLDDSGPGLTTSSDEAAIGFDGRKSGASLPWGGQSGKTKWGLDASLLSRGMNPLLILGGIVMICAVIPVISPPRRWVASGIVALTGLLIVAAGVVSEQAPWVFVLAILAFLGVAGWLGYEAWRNKRREVALKAIVKGVNDADTSVRDLAKKSIGDAAGDRLTVVKSEVNATKAKARIAKTT
jgi:hypothetical protein